MSFEVWELKNELKRRPPLLLGFFVEDIGGGIFKLRHEGRPIKKFTAQGETPYDVSKDIKQTAEDYLRKIKTERR